MNSFDLIVVYISGRITKGPAWGRSVPHGNSGLGFLQHPDDLLFTKPTSFHDASPLVVLYPEKLSSGWTKFRGAGHKQQQNQWDNNFRIFFVEVGFKLPELDFHVTLFGNFVTGIW